MQQRFAPQGAAMTKHPITLTCAALALAGVLGACSGGGSDDGDAARVAIMRRSRSPSAGPRQRCRWFASLLPLSAVCFVAAELVRIRGSELDLNSDPLGPYRDDMVDAGENTAVEQVYGRQRRDGGAARLRGADPTEWPCRVRHLVIFRAPIVGCARPVA
jgi:hypothetical protein